MKRFIVGTILGGVLVASTFGGAFADSANQSTPGTPGTANCVGQTTAYLAQVGQAEGIHGIGGVANAFGYTVQQVHDIVEAYCAL